jgi:anti-sigma regulatory factor (Ser/Thr protein kinase)/RimJ/RimL family protein N-acetyltransferase
MTDELNCDYSKITIPNDRSYIGPVCTYVTQLADKFGFSDEESDLIREALAEATTHVIERAFEPGSRDFLEISCERVPMGMQIVIRDRGLPFDPAPLVTDDVCAAQGGAERTALCLMKEYMDEVEFRNLGNQGQEIVLVKYARNSSIEDYYDACELEPYSPHMTVAAQHPLQGSIHIEAMKPDQAIEVCRTLYKAYGYSYFYPHMYYPERIVELNRSGHLFSAVALNDDGEVVGHGALMKTDPHARIAELGIGAVKPEYRARGVLKHIAEVLTDKAQADGLLGLWAQAVTNHTFSQQVGLRMGFKDTAILLAYVPETSSFKGISDRLSQRDSMDVQYLYLNKPSRNTVFLPDHHSDVLIEIYRDLGLGPELDVHACPLQRVPESEAVVRTVATNVTGLARIHVDEYGKDVLAEVKARLKDLCMKKFETIYLYLDLSDPFTCLFTLEFEKLGFFFSGLLPGAATGDALILQYLNNVPIDYEKLRVKSEAGRSLLDYVRRLDPNQ